ncbi:replication factor C subunit 4-like [Xenia sp. Carnegie-2017]|uniref:replication factor C subunit 4-like n=1 Tax=Xenia sp. Carnegie-2017 TaxID=2897299 RepID=UPI001F0504FC|nr:replication factor C subunit 4-like [Xenia sp. Carnegie-2017]
MDVFLKGATSAKSKAKSKIDKEPRAIPWVEKYRPKSVDEVAYQDEVVNVLKRTLELNQAAELPNLLFYGPPGTGKTSTILAIARQLYGPELMKDRVLELNASDERGIEVVRNKVKKFSQRAISTAPSGKKCPPFKIVILDEADSMTRNAQAALRRTMEKQNKTTRFCLICNYVSRIIEPLTSRCSKFRFKPLHEDILLKRLKEICVKESVLYETGVIEKLVKVSDGDMRKAITYLQSASRLKGSEEITKQDIVEISGIVPDKVIDDIFHSASSNSFEKLDLSVKNLMLEGYPGSQIISQIYDRIVGMDDLTDKKKSVITERLGIVDKCLIDGADEYLQLLDLCSTIMTQICQAEN